MLNHVYAFGPNSHTNKWFHVFFFSVCSEMVSSLVNTNSFKYSNIAF